MANDWRKTYEELKKRKKAIDKVSNEEELNKAKQSYGRTGKSLYTGKAIGTLNSNQTPSKKVTTTKKKKDDRLFSAFDDGYDFGDVTKTILTGGRKVTNFVDEEIVDPLRDSKKNYQFGKLTEKLGMESYKRMNGEANDYDKVKKQYDKFIAKNPELVNDANYLDQTIQTLPNSIGGLVSGVKGGGIGAGIGAIGGAIIGAVTTGGAGAGAGALAGAKWLGGAGYVTGSAEYTYKLESGLQYQALIEMGVPEDIAKEESKDTGTVNAFIEGGESILDLVTLGGLSAIKGALTKGLVKKYGAKTVAGWVGENVVKNAASELVEETAQETVSIHNEKQAMERAGLERDDSQDLERIVQSGIAGGFAGGLMGGGRAIISGGAKVGLNTIQNKNKVQSNVQMNDIAPIKTQQETTQDNTNPKQQYYQYVPKDTDSEQRRIISEDASKYANNTTRTHEFVDFLVNVSEATGINFRLANNEAELIVNEKNKLVEKYANNMNVSLEEATKTLEKKTIDAYNNGDIVLNVDTPRALNRLVGHELNHSMEGTKEGANLRRIAIEFAKTKNEYDSRVADLQALYEGTNADIEGELVSDIIGDYLFTDQEFINNLHTQDRNLFQRIYDEVKHLIKMATAGSKEARQLEQLKHSFEKAMRENKTTSENTINPELAKEISYKTKNNFKDNEVVEMVSTDEIDNIERSGGGYRTTEEVNKLTEGIKKDGITEPLNVEAREDGSLYLENGNHRLNQAKELGLEEVPVVVSDKGKTKKYSEYRKTPSQAELDNLEDIRLNKSGSEYADAFYKLEKKYGKKNLYKGLNSYKTTGKALDTEYSLSEAGTHGNLMAIHNLNENKLKGIMELGGFPVPSIAITKTENTGSNQFGDITVLFDKNTIDPSNRLNEVYDRDAWTPTFPSVEYEIDNSKLKTISKKLGLSNIPNDSIVNDATLRYFYEENIGDRINSYGLENLIEEIKDSKSMKYTYLRATDSTFEPVMKTEEFSNEFSNESLQRFLDNYKSETPLKELDYEQSLGMAEQIKTAIKPELERDFGSDGRFGQELITKTLNSFNDNYSKIDRFLRSAKQLQRLGNEHQVMDEKASLDKANEVINTEEYNKWVEDNFKDIVSNKGIRNDKDLFTPSGNRRSFSQTHDEYNLANIVKLMVKGRTTGGQKGFFAGGFGSITANMSHKFTSIEDIKSRESQLMTDAEAKAIIEPLRDKLQSDIEELAKYYDTYESNPFIKFDRVNEAVLEFSEKSTTNISTFKKVLDSWHGFKNVPTKVMQSIVDDLNALKTIPTDYFEAKPQRAVGLNEAQAIVIPNDTSTEFKQQLQDAGLKYYEYDKSIEGDRQRVINQFDDLKFSLSNQEQDIAPTSADIFGSEIRVQQQVSEQVQEAIAPLKETIQELNKTITTLQENIAPIQGYTDEDISLNNQANLDSLTAQSIAPIENTTPDVMPTSEVINDPFENRDIKEVGKRNVKAYMFENPEVKPFFQQEARTMLGDLHNSIKGEKIWLQELNQDTGLYQESMVTGTKRLTTDDIAELLDVYHYTYAQIETGLKAIIEDNGKENNAVSKRIEFMLNDRLLNGYKSVDGFPIPPNEEYRALIQNKNIQEYTEQAYQEWNKNINQDDLVPTNNVSNSIPEAQNVPLENDIAPTKVNTPVKSNEPRIENIMFADPTESLKRQAGKQIAEEMRYTNKSSKVSKPKSQLFGDAWGKFREQFFNSFHYVDKFARDTGNQQIKYNTDMYNNVFAEINGELTTAQTDNYGNPIGEALLQPFEEAKANGEYEQLNDYLMHYSNIDRHLQDKGSVVPLEYSKEMIAEYDKVNPNLKEYARRVWRGYKNDLANMQSNGLISGQFNMTLQKMYPHFTPFMFEQEFIPSMEDDGVVRPKQVVKRAEGGAFEILEMEEARVRYTQSVRSAIRKNDVLKEIVHTSDKAVNVGADVRIDPTDINQGFGIDEKGRYFATAYIDGQMQQAVISEDIYRELTQEGKQKMRALEDRYALITKPLQKLSRGRRMLLTELNPMFIATNFQKDVQDASFNSKYTKDFMKYYPTALPELASAKTDLAKQFLTLYGSGNSYGEYNTDNVTKGQKNSKFVKNVINVVPKLNNLMELAPRFAEFKASLDNGANLQEAMYNAREVTVNFGRGGYISKFLNNNGFTFFNTSMQGFDKLARNFSGENGARGVVGALAKVVTLGIAPALFNALAFGVGDDEDEDYKALPDYIKDNYYIIKTGDGEFIRIPKGRMLSIFGSAARRTLEYLQGEKDAFEGYLKNAYSQVGVQNPLESNIFAPLFQAFGSENGRTWYGTDLVPTRLQNEEPEDQYDESTDEFSKWLGQMIGVSPYKINYVIDQYSGGIGDLLLPTITEEATSDGSFLAPIKDKFTANTTFDNKYVSDFYGTKEKFEKKSKSSRATDEDILRYKYLNSVSYEMSELYKEKRAVQSNSELTKEEKFERVQEIQKQINSLAEEGLNNYQNINRTSNYAIVGDKEYYKDANSEWRSPYDDELEEINSLGMDIDDKSLYFEAKNKIYEINEKYRGSEDTYEDRKRDIINVVRNSKLNTDYKSYLYGKYYSEDTTKIVNMLGMDFDAYLDYESQNFVADKDKNGKSISGSKKKKVFAYINSMNIPFEQKIILAKLQYNSYDEYNHEIIQYLNNDPNISYDDMVFILKQMGFEVDNEGNIYWD